MNPAKVVVSKVERKRGLQVLPLLTKAVKVSSAIDVYARVANNIATLFSLTGFYFQYYSAPRFLALMLIGFESHTCYSRNKLNCLTHGSNFQ